MFVATKNDKHPNHIVYRIEIQAHVRSWQMWRRCSEFAELHTELVKSTGSPPPAPLPPKNESARSESRCLLLGAVARCNSLRHCGSTSILSCSPGYETSAQILTGGTLSGRGDVGASHSECAGQKETGRDIIPSVHPDPWLAETRDGRRRVAMQDKHGCKVAGRVRKAGKDAHCRSSDVPFKHVGCTTCGVHRCLSGTRV